MALFAVITEACANDAQRHGQAAFVANVKRAIDEDQNLTGFDFFFPTPFVKKSLGRSFRMIGYRVPIGDDEIILLLRVLARGSNEYEYFLANWNKNTDAVTRDFQPHGEDEIRRIYAELTSAPPQTRPPEPNSEERAWLYEVFEEEDQDEDLVVLETESWVKKMRSAENRDFLALYHQLLEQVDIRQLGAATSDQRCNVHWDDKARIGVVYSYWPDLDRLVFIEPVRSRDEAAVLMEHYSRRLSMSRGQHDLSRMAARSYPFLMLLDQDAWLAIQKDEEANLALSPEEAELLEAIRRVAVARDPAYPLFINGRAGSGKSTMLQYLAADYLDFALRRSTSHIPLYMTCSRDLLERARGTVRGLLKTHHRRLLKAPHDAKQVESLLSRSFVVFHEFLYSILPADVQKQFAPARYVNYAEFRRLWSREYAKRPEAQKISVDVAWHTIRSFIKGMRSGHSDDLTPEEFSGLPRRRRSVSAETYQFVYERVWSSWYQKLCEEHGYWDDQDLAAAVLEAGVARHSGYAALFCDEAQDFTSAEMDIIFQLSIFGKRSLKPEDLRRVPIVFAGDPLQTINPTGFRWDAVQADFHERFCAVLDPRRTARLQLNYKELRLNYRSNPGIVKFCNLIQLVRAGVLGAKGTQPQEAWWVDSPVQTVWFATDSTQTQQQLQLHPELVKLVNCEEGEETEYASSDAILRTLNLEKEGIYRNVLGPTRAKGLEFPAVVLYRFGETAPRDFGAVLRGEIDLSISEQRLPYEYFFNRLYVAASRAKAQLVIVDSAEALDRFWKFAADTELIDQIMALAGGKDLWQDSINYLVPGTEEAWRGERIDPREQALEYAAQGRRKHDSYLLRQAALAYRSSGDEFEAGRCLAQAAELEGKHLEAGNKYRAMGLNEEAFRCYWTGQQWSALCDLIAHDSTLSARLQSRAAVFMARANTGYENLLQGLLAAAENIRWLHETSADTIWREVFGRLAERLADAIGDSRIQWQRVQQLFKGLAESGVPIKDTHLAAIAFAANDFSESVRLWERSGGTDRDEYCRAKARSAPFPENILWWGRLKEHKALLQQWRAHSLDDTAIDSIDERVVGAVADAAFAESDLVTAANVLQRHPDPNRLARLLIEAVRKNDVQVATAAAVLAARFMVRTGAWIGAIRAAESIDFSELPGVRAGDVRPLLSKTNAESAILRTVLYELAVSDQLVAAAPDRQSAVAEFLHRQFIGKASPAPEQRGIRPEVVGAAIERAGKIVDALQYYEHLEREASTDEIKRFAAERLVRNLGRHADYFASRGNDHEAKQRQARAQQIVERLGLGSRRIPEYPVVQPQSSSVTPEEWVRGPFRVVLSRAHGRVRIEHSERFETVTLDGRDGQLLGDASFVKLESGEGELGVWEIVGWNVKVRLSEQAAGRCAIIEIGPRPLEIPLGAVRASLSISATS